jgi:hypothetical protein
MANDFFQDRQGSWRHTSTGRFANLLDVFQNTYNGWTRKGILPEVAEEEIYRRARLDRQWIRSGGFEGERFHGDTPIV